ncbi:unnamed protein product, partial [Prorocentrum cordatum]
ARRGRGAAPPPRPRRRPSPRASAEGRSARSGHARQAQGVVPTRQSVQRLTDSSRQSPVPTVLTMDGSCVAEDFDEDMRECIAAYEESSLRCASPSGSLQMRPPTSSRARFVRQTNSLRDSWGSGPHGDPAGGAGEHPWPGAAPPGAAPGSPGGFQVPGAFGPVLTVMVGGVEFKSTGSTLRRAPHFESVLSQGGQLPNPLFIDRSGDLFKYILDYLRSGHWLLGSRACDEEFLGALRQEAAYYGLGGLVEANPWPCVSEYVTIWQYKDDTSLYVDCQEETIREDPDHKAPIKGLFRLCKYSGGLPLDLQTNVRRFKAASNYMQAALAYFGMSRPPKRQGGPAEGPRGSIHWRADLWEAGGGISEGRSAVVDRCAVIEREVWLMRRRLHQQVVLLLRMSPMLPAEVFNYACAAMPLPFYKFALGCLGSAVPISFWVFTSAQGAQLARDGDALEHGHGGAGAHRPTGRVTSFAFMAATFLADVLALYLWGLLARRGCGLAGGEG